MLFIRYDLSVSNSNKYSLQLQDTTYLLQRPFETVILPTLAPTHFERRIFTARLAQLIFEGLQLMT